MKKKAMWKETEKITGYQPVNFFEEQLVYARNKNLQQLMQVSPRQHPRMEEISRFGGVQFLDDTPSHDINALFYALENIQHPILWITGGADDAVRAFDIFGPVTGVDRDTGFFKILGSTGGIHIRAGDLNPHAFEDKAERTHGNAADSDKMDVFSGQKIGAKLFDSMIHMVTSKRYGRIFGLQDTFQSIIIHHKFYQLIKRLIILFFTSFKF